MFALGHEPGMILKSKVKCTNLALALPVFILGLIKSGCPLKPEVNMTQNMIVSTPVKKLMIFELGNPEHNAFTDFMDHRLQINPKLRENCISNSKNVRFSPHKSKCILFSTIDSMIETHNILFKYIILC